MCYTPQSDSVCYTPQFWEKAEKLLSVYPKECEKCHFPEGWVSQKALEKNPKHRRPLVVRLALRRGREITPENLGLFCTRCRRGPYYVIKAKKEDVDKLYLPMFSKGETKDGTL